MVIRGLERDGVALRYCEEGQRRASCALIFVDTLGTDLRICGDEDGITPFGILRELSDMISDASYLQITRTGHLPGVEQSALISQPISAFISEHALG
jgi:pimeloyl-ACP methyl ester carboxylesterase